MYSGTFIDDLIKTVERTERLATSEASQPEGMEYWHSISQTELAQFESSLAGVA
jgi:hypothetical protein